VQRVIISGSTGYRRFQRAATKQRFSIRFRDLAYGTERSAALNSYAEETDVKAFGDSAIASGMTNAPPRLANEMAALLRFKTATLTARGLKRNGVWCDETASLKLDHFACPSTSI
jgi:hypothetical protein